jgi:hypothetical protein
MDRTGRCAERHNATTTGPARVIRELLVEVNGTDKPRDSFIYSYEYRRKSPAQAGLSCVWLMSFGGTRWKRAGMENKCGRQPVRNLGSQVEVDLHLLWF